ncbi:MAG TPA: Nramp family divalent metal transporter [Opitutaceae bacterium]
MASTLLARLRTLGPGLLLAAAGIGAGDVVVASVTGIKFGYTLLWAIVFTAALKFVVTEGLARWQVATGETVVYGWVTRLPRVVTIYFGFYLLLWTFFVGSSLSSACGIAGASLFPGISVPVWGAIHAILAATIVALNRFKSFQKIMKALIAFMALSVFACALLLTPPPAEVIAGLLIPRVPTAGGGPAVLALLGGIGGSLTVICYAYWLREAGGAGSDRLKAVRGDVGLAYAFTGAFAIALCIIAAGVQANAVSGARIAIEIAARLETVAGPAGRWIFLGGFWCTVFTAMLGVWQGVPSVYVDLVSSWRRNRPVSPGRDRKIYLGALVYLALAPLILLWFRQPVAIVVTFAIVGAFFMPFLAATLLYMNNRRDWMGDLANRWLGNVALVVCLLVFGAVCVREIAGAVSG